MRRAVPQYPRTHGGVWSEILGSQPERQMNSTARDPITRDPEGGISHPLRELEGYPRPINRLITGQ